MIKMFHFLRIQPINADEKMDERQSERSTTQK